MMDRAELEEAFQGSIKEIHDDPEGFVICHVAAMTSMVMLRAAMLAIIENPTHASSMAVYALEQVEGFTPREIAKSLGRVAEGPLN